MCTCEWEEKGNLKCEDYNSSRIIKNYVVKDIIWKESESGDMFIKLYVYVYKYVGKRKGKMKCKVYWNSKWNE
jgi:hypothetical protein